MRTIYRGVYGATDNVYVLGIVQCRLGGKGYIDQTLRKLQSLQGRAARVMSGSFKAISLPALDIEMYLLLIE
jgi:hypothetical protein